MRLWLITALVALVIGQVFGSSPSERIAFLPDGYPDGTLITIYLRHDGYVKDFRLNEKYRVPEAKEPVRLRFFAKDTVSDPDWPEDDFIEVKADKEHYRPISTSTNVKKTWIDSATMRTDQFADRELPSKGHWKFEIYKHDDYNLNVFFEEYHAGVRRFEKYLGDTKSIYLLSDNVELTTIQVTIKLQKDSILPSLDVHQFYVLFDGGNRERLITFSEWTINGYIEMTLSMRVSKGSKAEDWYPGVDFYSHSHSAFLEVSQMRQYDGISSYYNYADTWLTSKSISQEVMDWSRRWKHWGVSTPSADQLHDRCPIKDNHNGDIQHVRLERIATNRVKLQIYYKPPFGKIGVECIRTIPDDKVHWMNNPFSAASFGGAVVFHMTSSLTKAPAPHKLN